MRLFDAYLAIDWSASSSPTAKKQSPDAVWVGERVVGEDPHFSVSFEDYFRTRWSCMEYLRRRLLSHRDEGRRVFVGFDFAYGYPAGFAEVWGLDGSEAPWRLVWNELRRLIEDFEDNANNRFQVAGLINSQCEDEPPAPKPGPFWGCPASISAPGLSAYKPTYPFPHDSPHNLAYERETESCLSGVQSTWQLLGRGSVGSQTLLGIPVVAALIDDPKLRAVSCVWPFETGFGLSPVSPGTPFILHAEIWPGVVNDRLDPTLAIRDQAQVRAIVEWLDNLDAGNELLPMFGRPKELSDESLKKVLDEEGWIFGSGLKPMATTSDAAKRGMWELRS